jgi:hypothetical protein
MARRTGNWVVELAYLVVSTALLAAAVIRVDSWYRWVLLAVLVVNTVVVGTNVRRFRQQTARGGRGSAPPA